MLKRARNRLVYMGILALSVGLATGAEPGGITEVPLEFSGGHSIGKNDFGRPVSLIAAALGVKPEQFRQAFSGVTPAQGGKPSGEQIRKNKKALLKVLAPSGVTNERLDEVSDYYRFRPQNGDLWKHKSAKGYAIIVGGMIKNVVITDPGSGYSVPPTVTIKSQPAVELKATLMFSKDLKRNGSIEKIEVVESSRP